MEMIIEGNSCRCIHNRTARIMDEILRDNRIFGVSEDSLHGSFGGLLEGSLHGVSSGRLFKADSEIHHGHISSWDTDSHSCELSIEGRVDLSNSLGSTSTGGDAVVHGTTSSTPVLSSLGRSVHDHLSGCGGVDGGHETLNNSKFFVNDLGERGQAVGSTRGIGKDGGSGILRVVDTHHIHGGIRRRSGDDDALASSLEVKPSFFNGGENTGRFAHDVSSRSSPADGSGVAFRVKPNFFSSHNEVFGVMGDLTRVDTMDGVILELVGGVLRVQEGIIHSNNSGI